MRLYLLHAKRYWGRWGRLFVRYIPLNVVNPIQNGIGLYGFEMQPNLLCDTGHSIDVAPSTLGGFGNGACGAL